MDLCKTKFGWGDNLGWRMSSSEKILKETQLGIHQSLVSVEQVVSRLLIFSKFPLGSYVNIYLAVVAILVGGLVNPTFL